MDTTSNGLVLKWTVGSVLILLVGGLFLRRNHRQHLTRHGEETAVHHDWMLVATSLVIGGAIFWPWIVIFMMSVVLYWSAVFAAIVAFIWASVGLHRLLTR